MPLTKIMTYRLQGTILKVEKTGEKIEDDEGNEWEKCIFTVELKGYSKRTPYTEITPELRDQRVKLVRYCCFDWHYKTGAMITLDANETEALLNG